MVGKATNNKVTRGFAIVIAFVFIFTSVFGNNLVVKAADETTAESNTEVTDTTEVEKKLVQCDENWTIFQYDDENGDSLNFDILYQGKTPEELANANIKIQYRQIYKSSRKNNCYDWLNFGQSIPDEDKLYLKNSVIEFKAITSDESSVLSLSDSFALYDAQAPFIMSMNPYFYEEYDMTNYNGIPKPNTFTVTLKYSEHLQMTSQAYICVTHDETEFEFSGYSASNLKVDNKISTHTIDNTEYTIEYSIVTFDVELPSLIIIENSNSEFDNYDTRIFYTFNIIGLESSNSQNQVDGFILDTWATVQCSDNKTNNVPVESVEISGTTSTIAAGESTQLTANVLPSNATVQTVTWAISNEDYATVDENGLVTAKTEGIGQTVIVYASSNDTNGPYAIYTLTITEPSIIIDPEQPTTESQTTETPTTEQPTTETPTNEVLTTEVLTTEAPTTEIPTTNTPVTNIPVTDTTQQATPPVINTILTDATKQYTVVVTSSDTTNPTVAYKQAANKKAKNITVPDTVSIDGITYTVTSIADNAFAKNKTVTKVTIGKNISSIGKNVFKDCTKLKTVNIKSTTLDKIGANAFCGAKKLTKITIKSTNLTKKSIGKNAFKGTNKKLVVKVPKKMVSKYKTYFKNKGNKTLRVKK